MFIIVTLLIIMLQMPYEIRTLRGCTPNTKFLSNGRLCFCDMRGYWNEANCKTIHRRHSCLPGQIIWEGCNQCICQEKGYLLCSNSRCYDDTTYKLPPRQGLSTLDPRCTPFKTYYVNCSICTCPATGKASEAQCISDISCDSQNSQMDFMNTEKIHCLPNVIYMSACLQCLCTSRGYFDLENCVSKCKPRSKLSGRRCVAGKFYKMGCSVCRCPTNGISDNRFCINTTCNQQFGQQVAHSLRTESKGCTPHSFTAPRCLYCDCSPNGSINENACLEIDCAKASELNKYRAAKDTCRPGEMVPVCTECFCSKNGQTAAKYCSRDCTYQSKISILERILKDRDFGNHFIERSKLKRIKGGESCIPNILYLDNGLYCLCPKNGDPDYKLCTTVKEESHHHENLKTLSNKIEIDYTSPCEPNSFVEFDCNTCYCNRNGKIDPKWCTYDDCDAKRLIQESHKIHNPAVITDLGSGNCHAGSISKFKCNFCICPESGILKEQACTQNECTEMDHEMYNDKLICDPLAYYEVDCNICYCPADGIKNVAKCTKNACEKKFLRSDSCIPGQLFSDDCNLCVCPPDGNKIGKACTNHSCQKSTSWQLKLSDDYLNDHSNDTTRTLDLCFPGEEFVEGCNLCICPELGLKMYATCDLVLCDEHNRSTRSPNLSTLNTASPTQNSNGEKPFMRSRKHSETCITYNISRSPERKECTPGTMYIVRCQQCICPYLGNINNFCRPLPKNMYCEQAFPYFNYLPMGRREFKANFTSIGHNETLSKNVNNESPNTKDNDASVSHNESSSKEVNGEGFDPKDNDTSVSPKETSAKDMNDESRNQKEDIQVEVKHEHTEYNCHELGKIADRCFICECEDGNVVIEEHCFKSDAESCIGAKPTFLSKNKVDL